VVSFFFYFDLGQYLTLESLKANRELLRRHAETEYVSTVVVFILIYLIQTAFSLPGAAVLTLLGGFLFGSVLGTFFVNIGATSGALLAMFSARYLFRDIVERRWGGRLEPIQRGFAENAFRFLLTIRLIPLFPFFLVNLACGLTRIRVGAFLLATSIGILPASFIFANAGRQLGRIESIGDILSGEVLVALGSLALLSLLPLVLRRVKRPGRTVA
jgi:uncharacterized membrane protein YdjX (TVP38/TMEM64 family)